MTYIKPNTDEIILPTQKEWEEARSRKEAILRYMCELEDVPYPEINKNSSRIERFLDAIYKGETIDLQPKSRNEILLQAIMNGEEIDTETYSRQEVLLMKVIKGDTDLSDVKPLQSRNEVYLAWLVLNGGLGNSKWDESDSYLICEDGTYLFDNTDKAIKLEHLITIE